MDLFYPLRTGENEELRYSLRSVSANLPHDRVFVAGGPDWLTNVETVGFESTGDKWADITGKFCAAVLDTRISDPFVFINDDMFVMEPCAALPLWWRADLDFHATDREFAPNDQEWAQVLRRTHDLLGGGKSWVTHIPFVVHKTVGRELVPILRDNPRVEIATMYHNYAQATGVHERDAKVEFLSHRPAPFWSSHDKAFAGTLGNPVRDEFPARCRYEA